MAQNVQPKHLPRSVPPRASNLISEENIDTTLQLSSTEPVGSHAFDLVSSIGSPIFHNQIDFVALKGVSKDKEGSDEENVIPLGEDDPEFEVVLSKSQKKRLRQKSRNAKAVRTHNT